MIESMTKDGFPYLAWEFLQNLLVTFSFKKQSIYLASRFISKEAFQVTQFLNLSQHWVTINEIHKTEVYHSGQSRGLPLKVSTVISGRPKFGNTKGCGITGVTFL
jgi:hypothetical protein